VCVCVCGCCDHWLGVLVMCTWCFVLFLIFFCCLVYVYLSSFVFVCTSVRSNETEFKHNCCNDDDILLHNNNIFYYTNIVIYFY